MVKNIAFLFIVFIYFNLIHMHQHIYLTIFNELILLFSYLYTQCNSCSVKWYLVPFNQFKYPNIKYCFFLKVINIQIHTWI